jgi:glycosyltransferase involved in cell wall biosynthesis
MCSAHLRDWASPGADSTPADRNAAQARRTTPRIHPKGQAEHRAQQTHGEYTGYRLVEFSGSFLAVPTMAGPVCLADPVQRTNPWIFRSSSLEQLREEIDRRAAGGHVPRRVEEFAGYEIFVCSDRCHAIPSESVADYFGQQSCSAENVFLEESLAQVRRRILRMVGFVDVPGDILGTCGDYVIIRQRDGVAAFPLKMQGVERLCEQDCAAAGVINGVSREQVEHAVRHQPPLRQIEFAGWLPAFEKFGQCGTHPQFGHTEVPPVGYTFVQSGPPPQPRQGLAGWKRRGGNAVRRIKVGLAMVRLFVRSVAGGARIIETIKFLRSRDLPSQLLLPRHSRLLFLTSVPFTYGQDPWVIEIEDVVSLLFPYVENGKTAQLDVRNQPGFRVVKSLLDMPSCRAIITHIQATADGVSKLFGSEGLARKTSYIPMGVRAPREWQHHDPAPTTYLLFTKSWHQAPNSFYVRGGLEVLEAFAALHNAYPELRLTLRTRLPHDLPMRHRAIIKDCRVTVLDEFLPAPELEKLMLSSHIFLLPAARIHIMSVLKAMAYGLVPIVSDGWGMREYVDHRRTGLVVRGRYGKVSWNDETNGMLREHYAPMYHCDPQVTQHLVDELSQLADDAELRRELGHNARREIETRFSLARWNAGLKRVLDRAWEGA